MPDDLPPPPPPPPAPPPPAPPPSAPPPPAPTPTAAPVQHRDSESEKAELRAEAASYRISARDAKAEVERLRTEIDSVKAQTQAQIDAAKAPLQQKVEKTNQRILTTEIWSAAAQAGLTDLDLIPLLDRSKVTVDDEGNVTGVAEAVAAFKKAKPEYFRDGGSRGSPPADQRRQSPPRNDPPAPRDAPEVVDVRSMTPQQYAAHKAGMGRRINSAR